MKKHFFQLTFAVLICALSAANDASASQPAKGTPRLASETQSHLFGEPILDAESAGDARKQRIMSLIESIPERPEVSAIDAITSEVEAEQPSVYKASMLNNLANRYFSDGYFSRAFAAWKLGWETCRDLDDPQGKLLADTCLGELARMYVRIGRTADLEALIQATQGRVMEGPGRTLYEQAHMGLYYMKWDPGEAFRCGTMAIHAIRQYLLPEEKQSDVVESAESSPTGFTLQQLVEISGKTNLPLVAVKIDMETAGQIPTPALVHWKLDHYAALIDFKDGYYLVRDCTFSPMDMWISSAAIEEEASGYFLVREEDTSSHRRVSAEEALGVHGKSGPHVPHEDATTQQDFKLGYCGDSKGMPTFSFHALLASHSVEDMPVSYAPVIGPAPDFTVVYNGREANQPSTFPYSNLGHKWNFGMFGAVIYNVLYPNAENVRVLTPLGGSEMHRTPNLLGKYTHRGWGTARLYKPSGSNPMSFERRLSDGSKEIYAHVAGTYANDRTILLSEIIDPQGNSLTLTYDGSNRLTSVTDAAGLVSTICYDLDTSGVCQAGSGKLIRKITDPYGRSAQFDYNGSGRLIRITDSIGMATDFTYSGDFLASMSTPYGTTTFHNETIHGRYRTRSVDPLGEQQVIEMHPYAPVQTSLPAGEVPSASGLIFDNLKCDYYTSLYWDQKAMREGADDPLKARQIQWLTDGSANRFGRMPRRTDDPMTGNTIYNYPGQFQQLFQGTNYAAQDNAMLGRASLIVQKLDDGQTQATRVKYDQTHWNVTETTNSLGRHSRISYDASGRNPVKVERFINGSYVTTGEATYNTQNLVTSITDAAGAVSTFTYNAEGQPLTATNALSETSSYDYSTTGLLLRVNSPDSAHYTEVAYDSFDRITSATTFPSGYTVRMEYDAFDRPTRVTYPDGTYEEQVYDRLELAASRDRAGQWTQYQYSMTRQLQAVMNPAGEVIQFDWCRCGELARMVDAEGRITAWDRDLIGRLTKLTSPGSSTSYEYEPLSGRLKTVTDTKLQTTNYTYNVDDSLASIYWGNVAPGTAAVAPLSFTYDSQIKRLVSFTDGIGTTELSYIPYDSGDGIYGDGSLAAWDGPWINDTISYDYDILGRGTTTTIGSGGVNVQSVAYDILDRVTTTTNALGTFGFEYAGPGGALSEMTSSFGHKTRLQYHDVLKDLRLAEIENLGTTGSLLSKFNYEHDVLGRITEWTKTQPDPANLSSHTVKPWTANYDPVGRLTSVESLMDSGARGERHAYRYDKAGNRLNDQTALWGGEQGVAGLPPEVSRRIHSNNDRDQVLGTQPGGPLHMAGQLSESGTVTQAPPSPKADATGTSNTFAAWLPEAAPATNPPTFELGWEDEQGNTSQTVVTSSRTLADEATTITYDANGNMTQKLVGSRTLNFEWDVRNQLTAIEEPGAFRSEFTYDGMGRRVEMKDYNATGTLTKDRTFLWHGLAIAEERGSDAATITTVYTGSGEVRLGAGPGGSDVRYFYTKDHLGSLREVTDSSGAFVAVYDYDPYGQVTQIIGGTDSSSRFEFLYTGHFYHPEGELYLAPYRAYDPQLGKWISRDPIGLAGGLNLYTYVNEDPVNGWDLLGLVNGNGSSENLGEQPDGAPLGELARQLLGIPISVLYHGTAGVEVEPGTEPRPGDNNMYDFILWVTATPPPPEGMEDFKYGIVGGFGKGVCPAAGTRTRPAGIPNNWRVSNTKTPGGTRYTNPNNPNQEVRIMQGDPNSKWPNSQQPYARQRDKSGSYLDVNGNRGPNHSADTHIPLGRFRFRPEP